MGKEELEGLIQSVAALFGVVVTLLTAAYAMIKYIKTRAYKKVPYYVARGTFADRCDSLNNLLLLIKGKVKIINIYGKRGIGKSSFLRFFCDFINKTLKEDNIKRYTVKKGTKRLFGRAFYIELSGSKSVEEQIIERMTDRGATFSEFVAQTAKRLSFSKRIFIVFDNINNAGLSRELEPIIDILLSHSKKYFILVGSVEKQPFLNAINEKQVEHIELRAFQGTDVFEFAEKNHKAVSAERVSQIIDFSQGLPVFVSLLLNNAHGNLSQITHDNDRMNKYIGRIIEDLNEDGFNLALFIGFLSITMAVLPVKLVKTFIPQLSSNNLEALERSALIEYDKMSRTVKMHELFRNYICSIYSNRTDIVKKIHNYYAEKSCLLEQSYYIIMAQVNDPDDIILQAVNKAVETENFSYLLLLGEHYKRLYDWQLPNPELNRESFLALVYGYLEGLIGIGDYPAAREVIDICKITSRHLQNEMQLRFSLLTAHLYHLQNNYEEAISTYRILLESGYAQNSKYEAKCFWGIAHSLRHQGYEYDGAIEYYDKAIHSATVLKIESEIIKNMREKLTIYLLRDDKKHAKALYDILYKRMINLCDGYVATRISFLKCEALYIKTMCDGDPEKEVELLNKALQSHKEQKKRLQYNTLFELGECYRRQKSFSAAEKNYHQALTFSRRNKDHNLETMTLIALAVNDICANKDLQNVLEERVESIVQACNDSVEYNLYTNKLLADMVLSFLQGVEIDAEIRNELKRIRYATAVRVCEEKSVGSFQKLDLYLM